MKNIILLLLIFIYSAHVEASFIAGNRSKINPNLPTHIMIAGQPDKLGELFVYSLLTRAKIYMEKSPNEQIIIVGKNDDIEMIKDAGFQIIAKGGGMLKPATISDAINRVNKISSVDIYAHSSPISGAVIDSNTWVYQLLDETDDIWNDIKKKSEPSSFVFIHGCNAGLKFAPTLAKKLKIAVFASLTSTDFEYIYKNSFWSAANKPDIGKKSVKNLFNYSSPKSCGNYCTRMKPDNFSYRGHWGDWSAGGYPTFKLFCGSNDNTNCEAGALEGIFTFPGTMTYAQTKLNRENFKKQLIDFMCPFAYDTEKQNACAETLAKNEFKTYSPFEGNTLVCDRLHCKAHFNCPSLKAIFNPSACSLENDTKDESTTFVDEYNFLMDTYKKIHTK